MAVKIWRYTVAPKEQDLWLDQDMKGWRKAFEACVEDEAREQGSKRYIILDRHGAILAKNVVRPLPKPVNEFQV
jgi:hypothetical protein